MNDLICIHCSKDGQLAILRASIPHRRPIRQQQFGPAPARFLLLAGQPLPYRVNQIIVGQLVVFLARLRLENGIAVCLFPFRVGRRDEADFVVENADQVIEILGATCRSRLASSNSA